MKILMGETVKMITSLVVKVSLMKVTMEIHIAINMMLTTLPVIKVSQMAMKMSSGEIVKMMTSSIVKVSLTKAT